MAEKFSDEHPAWVSVMVVTELSWVLGWTYDYSRMETAAFIRKLLDTASILVEDEILVSQALDLLLNSTGDFNEPSHLDWTEPAAREGKCPTAVAYPTSVAIAAAGLHDAFRKLHPDEVATFEIAP